MAIVNVSFRYLLVETMERFLATQAPVRAQSADFLAEVIFSLASHREEGASLYPVVFICEELASITEGIGGKDPIWIGQGPVRRDTVQQILKQCAPLSEQGQWAIFITLDEVARYGVFRTESSPLSPTTFGSLRALERDDLFLLGLLQIGESGIEVRAANGEGLHLYLSGSRSGAKHPKQVIQAVIGAVSRDAQPELLQALRDLFYRVFTELSRDVHGALIAVLPMQGARMDIFTDAVLLEEPVSLPEAIRAFMNNPGLEEVSRLYAYSNLIRGMLGCDGITLFRADGVLLGYNAFIQTPTKARHPGIGGARRRAFEALAYHVGHGVNLAMYRSQDGAMDYVGIP